MAGINAKFDKEYLDKGIDDLLRGRSKHSKGSPKATRRS
jgi:hypothetical protein